MCGRYSLFVPPEDLKERFSLRVEPDVKAHYNAAPQQDLPVIRGADPDVVTHCTWGFVPAWADDPADAGFVNARAETVDEKRSFRDAYERRRCLVPADGFYEWTDPPDGKRPYRFTRADGAPFAMAGLWERWEGTREQTSLASFAGGDGDRSWVLETFTILTTQPNDVVADVHDRMAVVLRPEDERAWLEGSLARDRLLEPFPADEMRVYPVSRAVNDPSNDRPEVVEPV